MTKKYEPRVVGLSCWQHPSCRNAYNYTVPKGMKLIGKGGAYEMLDRLSGREGWVIGHFDGQGHYACPECNTTVYDPYYLNQDERPVGKMSPVEKPREYHV